MFFHFHAVNERKSQIEDNKKQTKTKQSFKEVLTKREPKDIGSWFQIPAVMKNSLVA